MNIYIVGHKSPDLDSIVVPVTYAEFLKKSKRYEGSNIIPVASGQPNKETEFVFEKIGVELPKPFDEVTLEKEDAIILVDHNEESQRHEKVVGEQVIEIVDHHKININFTSPIRIDAKPLGSSSALVYEYFDTYGIKPSEGASKLMLAAILSDTQGLKSSTTTGYDSEVAHRLAEETGLDLEKFTFEIFKAKSDITGLSVEEIAKKDYKILDFGGTKVFINQLETVEPDKILEMAKEIADAMENVKVELDVSQTYTVVTNVLKINSHIIYTTEEEQAIAEEAFTTEGDENVADIGPLMSRKKDISPAIEKVITK
ncbi:DHH family phosphoesterase [Patescibacteria group bacterium]